MNKQLKNAGFIVAVLFFFIGSCAKESSCKQCSAVKISFENDSLISIKAVDAELYCEEALIQREANLMVDSSALIDSVVFSSTTSYICE